MTWILLAIFFMLFGLFGAWALARAGALADRRAEAMRRALEGMEPTGGTFEEHA